MNPRPTTELVMTNYCPQCGRSADGDVRRCPDDGARLRSCGDGDDSLAGLLIADRFRLIERIGSGGFGNVYRAIQLSMKRQVAVKILRRKFDTSSPHHDRFVREASLVSSLRHPNIVAPVDFGHDPEHQLAFLVMEYIDGIDLGDLIDGRRLDSELALEILYQACGGLSDAHRKGVIHRDLKPRNLRLSVVADGSVQVKLLDLGIAKPQNGRDDITREDNMPGTTAFLAPEYILNGDLAGYSDQYALGILLYLMLTGTKPFTGNDHQVMFQHVQSAPPSISAALPEGESIPDDVEQLHRRLAAKDPNRRFDSVRQVRRYINEVRSRYDMPAVSVDDPPESISVETFRPWIAGEVTSSDEDVESLPSDLVDRLQGAGAEVTTADSPGRSRRVKLPTPPPLPAQRAGSKNSVTPDDDGPSAISLPKPGRSDDGDDNGGVSLPKPGRSRFDSPAGTTSTPDRRTPPERTTTSQTLNSGAKETDTEQLPDVSTPESRLASNLTGADGIIDRLRNHTVAAVVAIVVAAVVLTALIATGDPSPSDDDHQDSLAATPQQSVPGQPPDKAKSDDDDSTDGETTEDDPPQFDLQQGRDDARDAAHRISTGVAVPMGQRIAEDIDRLTPEHPVDQRSPSSESAGGDDDTTDDADSEAADEIDDLDRLLDRAGRP